MVDQSGDVLNKGVAERALFPARGLPGGGQLEIRMEISANHPDPDIRRVARSVKPTIWRAGIQNGARWPLKTKSLRPALLMSAQHHGARILPARGGFLP